MRKRAAVRTASIRWEAEMARTARFLIIGLSLLQLGPIGAAEPSADQPREEALAGILESHGVSAGQTPALVKALTDRGLVVLESDPRTTRIQETKNCTSQKSWIECYRELYGSAAGGLPYPHDEPVYDGIWPYKMSGGLHQVNDPTAAGVENTE